LKYCEDCEDCKNCENWEERAIPNLGIKAYLSYNPIPDLATAVT